MRIFLSIISFIIAFSINISISKVNAGMNNVPKEYKKAMSRCARCHNFDKKKSPRTGPSLFGVMGRKVGTLKDFRFSKYYVDIGNKGHVWNEKDLLSYLENNKKYLREKSENKKAKGRMNFNTKSQKARKEIIEYLKLLKE